MADIVLHSPSAHEVTVRDYLTVSTVVTIFLQLKLATAAVGGFDFYIGYVVILANSLILLICGQMFAKPQHLFFLALLAGVSGFAALIAGAPPSMFVSQMLGISVLSIYYFSALASMEITLARLMEIYATCTVIVTIIGFPLYFAGISLGHEDPRLASILPEPSIYVATTLPAVGFYLQRFLYRRQNWMPLAILLAGYAFANSSLGYIGLFLTIFLVFGKRSRLWLVLGLILLIPAAFSLYYFNHQVQMRLSDTARAILIGGDLAKTNASTVALLSNAYVSYHAFIDHPLVGVGLGGYRDAYMHYVWDVLNKNYVLFGLNSTDANSLFLRVTADLGLFGWACIGFFFYYFSRVKGETYVLIRNSILPYFALKLLRFGHYFALEFMFFTVIYVFNYLSFRYEQVRTFQNVSAEGV